MRTRGKRAAAAAAVLAVALACAGCGGGGGSDAANVSGRWTGTLTVTFAGGGGLAGGIGMDLSQQEDFAVGIAEWGGYAGTMSVGGPLEGNDFTLYLHFRCAKTNEEAVLRARVDGGSMTIASASGTGCATGGAPQLVNGASGTLTRASDNLPL